MNDAIRNKWLLRRQSRLRNNKYIQNRYIVGCDISQGFSNGAYVLFDKKRDAISYITTAKWKIKLGLLLARAIGWRIMMEK